MFAINHKKKEVENLNNKSKKIGYFVVYAIATATILALIVPIIEGYLPLDNKVFDFQIFTFAIIGMIIAIFFAMIFPKFRERGKL